MSHNGCAYYTDQTAGPGWQQPGYSGPPQNQGPQFSPQNQNPPYPHQNLSSPSFAAKNQGPQFTPQNQGPAYPLQEPGTSYPPQNQSSLFATQNQGPRFPPQNQGPFCPTQNQGPSFPPQGTEFPPQNQGPQFHPQNHGPLCPSQNQVSQFSPQNQGPPIPLNQAPLLPPQNKGPLYPPQYQGPPVIRQNQGSPFLPQNQGPRFSTQNQGPPFPPQNQGPPFPAQNQNPCPSQNQGHFFPANQCMQYTPQNQGPQFPPQNQGPRFPPQNLGPQFTPQNQGNPFPAQNQGPMGPPQNQQPQFPQNQGALIHQQNQIPLCCLQNQAHVFPPQNQGPLYSQNQGPPGPPQNQGCPCPILNPGPPIPLQNQGPPFHPQNQCPLFPENQGHRFPPRNQDPRFPQNNEPSYAPRNQGPAYTHSHDKVHHSDQQHDNWESSDAYPEDEECCDSQYEDYGDDWSNKNNEDYEDDWANQNEDDWGSQTHNRNKKIAFKRRGPSTRRRGKDFDKNDLIEKGFKKTPLIKRLRKGPTKNPYQSTSNNQSSSKKQCSNNILVNIVESSDLDCCKPPQTSKLKTKHLVSSMNESTQTYPLFKQTALESSKQYKKQEANVCTKSIQGKFNLKSNENSTQKRGEQSQETNPAQAKEMDSKIKSTKQDSSATSNLQNDNLLSKSIQNISTQSLDQGNKQDNVFKSNRGKCDPKSNEKAIQSKDKPIQKLNKSHDKEIENRHQKDAVLTSNHKKDDKQSQVNQNISTDESAKQVKKLDYVHLNLNDTCTAKPGIMLLQHNNYQSLKTKKAQAKEVQLENANGDPSLTLNQQKSSPSNNIVKSQKTSNFQQEKLSSSKRLHPQDGNSSIITKKIKICELLSKEKPHSPSKVLAVDSNPKSKPEIQDKIKGTSSAQDKVEINETTFDQTSLSQPTDKLDPNLKIKIENTNGENFYQTENLPQLKETTSIPNKITTNNTDVNQTFNMSQLTNETVVKSGEENPYQALNIKTEPDDCIMKASDVKNQDTTNNVTSKEALTNEMVDRPETNSTILVQNNTNSSQVNSISPDSSGNIHSEQLQSNCNESTPDVKSQNSDFQINYKSSNDDSQNSSELSGDGINPLKTNLREVDILDEVEGSGGDEGDHLTSEESDSEASEQVLGVGIEDIDAMLEEGLPTNQKGTENNAPKKLRHKIILEEIGRNHFDLLPEGWIQIIHNSGMPVYLQQKTRVCTMARPYFLGPGSARSHKVPLSGIPCLQYKRALEIEKKYEQENQGKQTTDSEQTNENRPPLMPVISAKIETAEENEAAQSIDPTELQDYCKKVFNFETISIIPFNSNSWGDRRQFTRMTKDLKKQQRPLLPSGTKLLKFPIQNPDGTISKSKGEWVINPNGKSYVCILHEYVQHALKQHPKYQFKELKNPATPYSATVYIGEMQYGTGMGGSKKHAKLEAARAALEVLIPEMKDKIERDSEFGTRSGIAKRSQNYENSIFDQIRIEDPRVAEFCAKTTEPPPYAILATCLQRNGMGLDEVKVEYNMNTKRHKEDEFKMSVRNHTATVLCKNKRDGKQKAAQAILKALHPNIEHFGSLLRMYGNHSIKSVKEKKQEEQQITGLQCKAAVNQPNYAILNKLHEEMFKLAVKRKEQQAKGKFHCHNDLLLPTASTTDLNKINL